MAENLQPRINHSSWNLISWELPRKGKSGHPHLFICLRTLSQSDCRISLENQLLSFCISDRIYKFHCANNRHCNLSLLSHRITTSKNHLCSSWCYSQDIPQWIPCSFPLKNKTPITTERHPQYKGNTNVKWSALSLVAVEMVDC